MTLASVQQIEDDPQLIYKTFLMERKDTKGKHKVKKIQFDSSMGNDSLKESMKTRDMQNKENVEISRVNPELFRNLKFMAFMTPDVLNQRSDDVERMYRLEVYDRAINNPIADQEQVTKDFLFGAYAISSRDPEKYISKQAQQGQPGMGGSPMPGLPGMQQPQQPQGQPGGMGISPPSQPSQAMA
jgi:hypothetical protein